MKCGFVICVLTLLQAGNAVAQENPVGLDFEQAMETAFTNDPGLAAQNAAVRTEEFKVRQSESTYYPRLSFYSNYNRISRISSFEIFDPTARAYREIEFAPRDRYNFGFSLSQEIYTFGRRPALKRVSRRGVEIARIDRSDYKRSTFDSVARLFAALLLARDNMKIQQDNMERAEEKTGLVDARISQGLATDYDRMQAELLSSRFNFDYNSARGDYQQAKSALVALIGWDKDYDFEPIGNLESLEMALPESVSRDVDRIAQIRRLSLSHQIMMDNVSANRSSLFPSLFFQAKYDWQNGYQPDINKIEGAWNLGLSLNWMLFDGFERKSRISQSRYQAMQAQNLMADMRPQLKSQIEGAQIALETSMRELELARQRLSLAQKGLELADARYRQGLLTTSDLLDAEQARADAENVMNATFYKVFMAKLDLKKAMQYYPELD